MKKVGILGGTFDPIHLAHLIAAEQALYYANLDEVWFMPAQSPPHKLDKEDITPINHRIEMIKKAIEKEESFKVCTIELNRDGPSYTLDTMKELRGIHPDYQFFFIIGGDMIEYLPKWYGINQLLNLVTFIGLKRPGFDITPKSDEEEIIYKQVKLVPMLQLDVSSSVIRGWIRSGRRIKYIVPEAVEHYIKEHRLYEG